MADFVPRPDPDFATWFRNLGLALTAAPGDFGVLPADALAVTTAAAEFDDSLETTQNADTAYRSSLANKNTKRNAGETLARATVRRIQAYPGLTDAARAQIHITVPDSTPTGSSGLAVLDRKPIATIDTSNRLQHVLAFRDADQQERRGKPAGVRGCEIWIKVGEAPAQLIGSGDPEDMRFLALDTASPYVMHFTQADAGKMVYYAVRWIANDGTKGPWGETVAATIVG